LEENFLEDLFYQKKYELLFESFKKNKQVKSSKTVKIYLETLKTLNKNLYLLNLMEYLRSEYYKFQDLYSLEEINYLLLKACLNCCDIDKFKYYRENFESNNYSSHYFSELYINFFSNKYLEDIENKIIEDNKSIDLFITLSRFYILRNDYKSAFDNYINTLQKAFIINENYYIEIIYSDLLKYYKFFNIDNELYCEILSEIENLNNPVLNYFVGLNEFYNFNLKKSYEYFVKVSNIEGNLITDYYQFKSRYLLKVIEYLNLNDNRVFDYIVKLIFKTFSYFEIKITLESLFEKRHPLFLLMLKEFLIYNFNLYEIELLNTNTNLFYKPKILISNYSLNKIDEELDLFIFINKKMNIYFEGLGLYGEFVYIVSYLAFKNVDLNIYFKTEQNNFLSTKSENILMYIKDFKFLNKISFYENEINDKIDFAFINTDFLDNFDKSKVKDVQKVLFYSCYNGINKIIN